MEDDQILFHSGITVLNRAMSRSLECLQGATGFNPKQPDFDGRADFASAVLASSRLPDTLDMMDRIVSKFPNEGDRSTYKRWATEWRARYQRTLKRISLTRAGDFESLRNLSEEESAVSAGDVSTSGDANEAQRESHRHFEQMVSSEISTQDLEKKLLHRSSSCKELVYRDEAIYQEWESRVTDTFTKWFATRPWSLKPFDFIDARIEAWEWFALALRRRGITPSSLGGEKTVNSALVTYYATEELRQAFRPTHFLKLSPVHWALPSDLKLCERCGTLT